MCGQGELVPWPNLLIPMEREVPTTGNEVTRSHSGNEAEPGVQSRTPASLLVFASAAHLLNLAICPGFYLQQQMLSSGKVTSFWSPTG